MNDAIPSLDPEDIIRDWYLIDYSSLLNDRQRQILEMVRETGCLMLIDLQVDPAPGPLVPPRPDERFRPFNMAFNHFLGLVIDGVAPHHKRKVVEAAQLMLRAMVCVHPPHLREETYRQFMAYPAWRDLTSY